MKIAILSASQVHMQAIQQLLLESAPRREIVTIEGGLDRMTVVADQEHPDLFILDGICSSAADVVAVEQMLRKDGRMAVVVLCENPTPEFLISAMRAGVRDVLSLPLESKNLLDAVTRIEQRKRPAGGQARSHCKVLVFIACKGGSGATFLASNLGYILAASDGAKVALLDLNLQFGDAALFVSDQVPANTLADVADNISRLDASLLAASMVQILPNYSVLAAPEDPEHAMGVSPAHVEALVNLARANYDYVILDLGRILSAATVKALDHADFIFPVLQETLPFIRDSKRLIKTLLALGYAKENIHPIVNRYERGGEIQLDDVESALGMKVFKTIPNSYEAVSKSVNQGVPMLKIAKHDAVTKALEEMVRDMSEEPHMQKSGWFSHIFHSA